VALSPGHPDWALPSAVPCGVPTFLDTVPVPRPPGPLANLDFAKIELGGLPFMSPEPNLVRATERAYSCTGDGEGRLLETDSPPLDLGVTRCSAARLRGLFLQLQPRRHQL
jgi:hypothetical protein